LQSNHKDGRYSDFCEKLGLFLKIVQDLDFSSTPPIEEGENQSGLSVLKWEKSGKYHAQTNRPSFPNLEDRKKDDSRFES
jgi:hypothetical protein